MQLRLGTLPYLALLTGIITLVVALVVASLNEWVTIAQNIESENIVEDALFAEMEHLRSLEWNEIVGLPRQDSFTPQSEATEFPLSDFEGQRILTPKTDSRIEVRLIFRWSDEKSRKSSKRVMVSYLNKNGEYQPLMVPSAT